MRLTYMVRWECPSEVRTICNPVQKIGAMRDLHCRPADIVRDLELLVSGQSWPDMVAMRLAVGSIKQNQGVL